MSYHFLRRGYPLTLLQDAALKAREQDRHSLLNPTPAPQKPENKDSIFLITTYHPHDNSLREIVYKNWPMLGRSPTTDFI